MQLSRFNSKELCLFDMDALLDAFSGDPELASIPNDKLPTTMQMLYISTGCDYGSGKASSIQTFWRYAKYITSGLGHTPGTLTDTSLVDGASDLGFLAFMRLVGCVHFHKHRSANISKPALQLLQGRTALPRPTSPLASRHPK